MYRGFYIFVSAFILFSTAFSACAEDRIKVTFVNPSRVGSAFWDTTTSIMKAAAADLNIDLKVVYASTPSSINRFRHIELVREEARSENKPDYLITHFRKGMAQTLLDITEEAGLKTFIFNTNADENERNVIGTPRGQYKSWIGHMYPDDVQAGYDMMRDLISEAERKDVHGADGKVEIIVLSGNQHSVAAINRNIGLKKAVEETGQTLHRILFARWQPDIAKDMTVKALERYPNTGIVWSANDNMIVGAMGVIGAHNQNILSGGMDWTTAGLKAIEDGKLTVSYGGHFMEAAWAMVMIYDHFHGQDFFDEKTPQITSFLKRIDRNNVGPYLHHFGDQNWDKVDFSRFSKVLNKDVTSYDFSLEALLHQMSR